MLILLKQVTLKLAASKCPQNDVNSDIFSQGGQSLAYGGCDFVQIRMQSVVDFSMDLKCVLIVGIKGSKGVLTPSNSQKWVGVRNDRSGAILL